MDPSIPDLEILILSNGPGELSTWVKPVVTQLRQRWGDDRSKLRISVVLSPCPNASGMEAEIARSNVGVDRVQAAADFFPFLLFGKTAEHWQWGDRGVIVFLGGDPLFPVILGWRLGYRTVVYAEWEALWHGAIDRFAIMQPKILSQVKPHHQSKFSVVGDLMTDAGLLAGEASGEGARETELAIGSGHLDELDDELDSGRVTIGLLPGSKAAKLAQGVPLSCAIADLLYQRDPTLRFVLPMAPALDEATLEKFAHRVSNPVVEIIGGIEGQLRSVGDRRVLETPSGAQIELHTEGDDGPRTPHYRLLRQCTICLTTVGANTAELGALGVPMVVVLPTNQLDAMRAWNGIPGLLANLPGLGSWFAKGINWWALRKRGLLAWPNLWAGRSIVPELVGHLTPEMVAAEVWAYLVQPERLGQMKQELRQVRGEPGAARKVVDLVADLVQSM